MTQARSTTAPVLVALTREPLFFGAGLRISRSCHWLVKALEPHEHLRSPLLRPVCFVVTRPEATA